MQNTRHIPAGPKLIKATRIDNVAKENPNLYVINNKTVKGNKAQDSACVDIWSTTQKGVA
jgi:hypothetical protein